MAFFAADAALDGGGTHRHPRDPVLGGRMAILATHLQRAHVHVEVGRRVGQHGLQIPMLGVRGPTACEVTGTAGLPGGPSDLLRDRGQVQRRVGEAAFARVFPVRAGRVMTDQAIDVGRVGEVEFRVHPAIADVAGGALLEVGADGDAGIVDHQRQTDIDPVLISLQRGGVSLPVPMGRLQHVLSHLRVTAQTVPGHVLRAGLAREGHQRGVVRRPGMMAGGAFRGGGRRLELALVAADALAVVGPFEADAGGGVRLVGQPVAAGAALRRVLRHIVMAGRTGAAHLDIHRRVQRL